MGWKGPGNEIHVPYQRIQKELYKKRDPSCIYTIFPTDYGIFRKGGNFAAMVVKKHFENQGYSVLSRYLLVRCPRKRETNTGFHFLMTCFGAEKINKVIAEAKKMKLKGGDPDLFVFSEVGPDYFFAEAKEADKVTKNQEALFKIIEDNLCPVVVVRIIPQ